MGWLQKMGRRHRRQCVECGSPLMPFTWPETRGRSGEFEMVLRGLPVLRCSAVATHPMREIESESSVALAEAIQSSQLAVARLAMFGDPLCCECGVGLDRPVGGTMTTRAPVDLGALGVVDVELTGPSATCEACATQQVFATYDPDDDYNTALCGCFDSLSLDD